MCAQISLFGKPTPLATPSADDIQNVFEHLWCTSVEFSNLTRCADGVEREDELSEPLAGHMVDQLLEHFRLLNVREDIIDFLRIPGTPPVRLCGRAGVSGHDLTYSLLREVVTEFFNARVDYCALIEDYEYEESQAGYVQSLEDGAAFVKGSPFVIFEVLEKSLKSEDWHRDYDFLSTQLRAERADALRKLEQARNDTSESSSNSTWCGPKSPSEWEKIFNCSWKTIRRRAEMGLIQLRRVNSKAYSIPKCDIPTP
jgi:hypothetical protein